jgi:hypothetical protein
MDNSQARAAQQAQDIEIMQKVNRAHREAFRERFPGQIEHAMRLTSERLVAMLVKSPDVVLGDPATWPASDEAVRNMAMALESLYTIYREQR